MADETADDGSRICALPGCARKVEPTEDGSIRLYCCAAHRNQGRRLRRLAREVGPSAANVLGEPTGASEPASEPASEAAEQNPATAPDGPEPSTESVGTALSPARPGTALVPVTAGAAPPDKRRHRSYVVAGVGLLILGVVGGGIFWPDRDGGDRGAIRVPGPTATATVTTPPGKARVTYEPRAGREPGSEPSPPAGGSSGDRVRPPRSGGSGAQPGGSGVAPVSAGGVSPRYGFESGTQGWDDYYGDLDLAVTSSPTVQGSRALRLTINDDDYSAAAVRANVSGGTTVTFHVWTDGESSGSLKPYIQDTGYDPHFAESATIQLSARRGWTTLRWTVPRVSVRAIGLEINSGEDHTVVVMDAVNW